MTFKKFYKLTFQVYDDRTAGLEPIKGFAMNNHSRKAYNGGFGVMIDFEIEETSPCLKSLSWKCN